MEPVAFETFGEELTTAQDDVAAEAARDHQEVYDPPRRQADRSRGADIRLGTLGNSSASRIRTNAFACPDRNNLRGDHSVTGRCQSE